MSMSGSDLTSSARWGIALLTAQASRRSGSELTTLPYHPGPKRACSRYTSGASHKPPASAWRNPSARRAKARGVSGGTDEEAGGVEGIEGESRSAAHQQIGDHFASDRRQQDAGAEVARGNRHATPSGEPPQQWKPIRGCRTQPGPRGNERSIGQPRRETRDRREQSRDAGHCRTRVVSGLLYGGSHVGRSIRL